MNNRIPHGMLAVSVLGLASCSTRYGNLYCTSNPGNAHITLISTGEYLGESPTDHTFVARTGLFEPDPELLHGVVLFELPGYRPEVKYADITQWARTYQDAKLVPARVHANLAPCGEVNPQ